MKRYALGFVFLWFLLGGVAHFALTAVEMQIVPPYVPWPYAAVIVSGVFELNVVRTMPQTRSTTGNEPPQFYRRLVDLSHAVSADSVSVA